MELTFIQDIIPTLNLKDDDTIYNIFNPTPSCDACGGFGIKDWEDNKSVLCECLLEHKEEFITFKLLKRLSTLTKNEVYHG